MLRTNLATRPFYNDRGVRAGLAGLALIAIALSLFNAIEILRLESAGRDARQAMAQNALQAREMRAKALQIRQSINQAQLAVIQTAAREANVLIDRRAFSWTALLNQFQLTLPPDVRIAGVRPNIDNEGRMLVEITVLARRVDDLNEFIEALESTGHFTAVLARSNQVEEDGTWRSDLQGYYGVPPADAAPPSPGASAGQAVAPRPSSEAGEETPANGSAASTPAGPSTGGAAR
jgi:Tfp pilus assembly protein PilN